MSSEGNSGALLASFIIGGAIGGVGYIYFIEPDAQPKAKGNVNSSGTRNVAASDMRTEQQKQNDELRKATPQDTSPPKQEQQKNQPATKEESGESITIGILPASAIIGGLAAAGFGSVYYGDKLDNYMA